MFERFVLLINLLFFHQTLFSLFDAKKEAKTEAETEKVEVGVGEQEGEKCE